MPARGVIGNPTSAVAQLRILAEECQLAMDLWLAAGKKISLGAASSEDYFSARRRVNEAVDAYHALLREALSGTDDPGT